MTADAAVLENAALQNVRRLSESRGLRFYVNPPEGIVPGFLGDVRPDAIAVGPDGGIVFQFQPRRDVQADPRLSEIARRLSGQPGWEFRAIYFNPFDTDAAPLSVPTLQQIDEALREARILLDGKHSRAALVTAWAALEGLARLARTADEDGARGSLSPLQAVQALAEEGYLENAEATELRRLGRVRNAAVHGDYATPVSECDAADVLNRVQAVAAEMRAVYEQTDPQPRDGR